MPPLPSPTGTKVYSPDPGQGFGAHREADAAVSRSVALELRQHERYSGNGQGVKPTFSGEGNGGARPSFSTELYGFNITTPPSVFISTVPSRLGVTVIFPLPKTSLILGNEATSLSCLFPVSGRSPETSLKFFANKVGRPVPIVSSSGIFCLIPVSSFSPRQLVACL
jgi:hypothetical protein